jgi:MSHA biogenesis protein MshJ
MTPTLKALFAKFDALNPRERLLVALGGAVLLYAGADATMLSPTLAKQKQKQAELTQLAAGNAQLATQIASLPEAAASDPDEPLRLRIRSLKESLDEAEKRLEAESVNLISPEEMSRVLEEFVAKQDGLRLVGMQSLPAEPMVAGVDENQKLPRLFKHGMVIEVEGGFDAIRRYLKALEASSWRLYWNNLELKTESYPRISAKLGVYTLSLSDQWLSL